MINFNILKNITLLLFLFSAISCSDPSKLELALIEASGNRGELEKVLKHYSQEKKDSLKYKAACFLIENMVYHYQIKEREDIVKDIENVSSHFLIQNIEHSFFVWQKQPWGKYIEFDQFCEDILPYRVANEPLSLWKKNFYNHFQPFIDEKLSDDCPLSAAQIVYDAISSKGWNYIQDMKYQLQIDANLLLEYRFGNCGEQAQFATYAMRALGIPGGIDIILQHPNDSYQTHFWSFVKDKDGITKDFDLFVHRPQKDRIQVGRKRGKVYRRKFGYEYTSYPAIFDTFHLPQILDDALIEDVSNYYFPESTIEVKLKEQDILDSVVYLCVFNNKEWIPICGTKVNNSCIKFEYIEKYIMYLPMFYNKGKLIPAASFVMLDNDNSIRSFIAEDSTERVELKRKFPMSSNHHFCLDRMIGGQFQVSNNSNFETPIILYTIKQVEDLQWHNISKNSLANHKKTRYVRYLSPNHGFCNIAEILFFDEGGLPLTGKPIGTEGSWDNTMHTANKAFDSDPLTFFDAPKASSSWTGLDFGNYQKIDKIAFLPRNDDNHIRGGDEYELFYWDKEWTSLGTKIGVDAENLIYDNVPKGAMLLLKNHTRGMQERMFTYENGKQVWW